MRTTYFNSLLLPVAIVLRVLDRFASASHDRVEPRPVGPARARELAAGASAHAGGRGDRTRRAHPRGTVAARLCFARSAVGRGRSARRGD